MSERHVRERFMRSQPYAKMGEVEMTIGEIWRAVVDAAATKAGLLGFPDDGEIDAIEPEFGGVVLLGEKVTVAMYDGYAKAVIRRVRPEKPGVCCRCGAVGAVMNKHLVRGGISEDNQNTPIPIHWRCSVCREHVCFNCTLTVPGSSPTMFYPETYCSEACRVVGPEEGLMPL